MQPAEFEPSAEPDGEGISKPPPLETLMLVEYEPPETVEKDVADTAFPPSVAFTGDDDFFSPLFLWDPNHLAHEVEEIAYIEKERAMSHYEGLRYW